MSQLGYGHRGPNKVADYPHGSQKLSGSRFGNPWGVHSKESWFPRADEAGRLTIVAAHRGANGNRNLPNGT